MESYSYSKDGGIVAQAVVDEQVFGKIRDYVVTE